MKNFKTNYSTLLCLSLTKKEGNVANSIVCFDKNRECYKWKIKIII